MAWRAIYCEPRREFLALESLKAALGVEALCPHETVVERRKRRLGGERKVEVQRPYFPGYLFALTDEIMLAENCRGVIRVLKNGAGEPMIVSPKDIKLLRDVSNEDGRISWTDATKLSHQFHARPGDIFEFVSGGFRGRQGKIAALDDLDSRGEVSVLIQAFGGEKETRVSHRTIGAVLKTA